MRNLCFRSKIKRKNGWMSTDLKPKPLCGWFYGFEVNKCRQKNNWNVKIWGEKSTENLFSAQQVYCSHVPHNGTMCVIKIKSFQWPFTWASDTLLIRNDSQSHDVLFTRNYIIFFIISILIWKGAPIIFLLLMVLYILYMYARSIIEML